MDGLGERVLMFLIGLFICTSIFVFSVMGYRIATDGMLDHGCGCEVAQ